MFNYSLLDGLLSDMVAAADKVFKDEWGDYPEYDLQDEKDCFRTCMDVVEEILIKDFPEMLAKFRFLRDSKLNKYFGGMKK